MYDFHNDRELLILTQKIKYNNRNRNEDIGIIRVEACTTQVKSKFFKYM
jgi:hypothetical protein